MSFLNLFFFYQKLNKFVKKDSFVKTIIYNSTFVTLLTFIIYYSEKRNSKILQ